MCFYESREANSIIQTAQTSTASSATKVSRRTFEPMPIAGEQRRVIAVSGERFCGSMPDAGSSAFDHGYFDV